MLWIIVNYTIPHACAPNFNVNVSKREPIITFTETFTSNKSYNYIYIDMP